MKKEEFIISILILNTVMIIALAVFFFIEISTPPSPTDMEMKEWREWVTKENKNLREHTIKQNELTVEFVEKENEKNIQYVEKAIKDLYENP